MYFLKKMLFLQFTLIAFSIFVTGQDIHEAAEKGDVATLKVLLERNPELINGKDFYGETSLHYACVRGHIDVVEFLIKKGANLHVKDNDEFSPLHFATGSGHKEVVSLLVSKGAKVNAKERRGITPLHLASSAGHTDIARLMLSNGAIFTFISTYHMEFSMGMPNTLTFPDLASSAKSLGGRSKDISTSPRSRRALRVAAEGTIRMMILFILGRGPFFQSSLRMYSV